MLPTMLNVLIADDDKGDRKLITRALEQARLPCKCTEAASVEEALQACEKCAFDCVIVDYRLPGQDGLAGVTALRERLPHTAIIMSTGQGDEIVATEAMKRGASDYIPKTHISAQSMSRSVINAVEKATLQKQVAEQRTELENFSRVLVHDLKAPIQSVHGFASLIEQKIHEGNRTEITDYCRYVVGAVRRMGTLIDTLYEYTKAGEHIVFEQVEMSQVMKDSLSNLQHAVKERNACVLQAELPAVSGNAPQLTQLLQNLIGNAIKYCKAEIPIVQVAAKPQNGNGWLFAVKDNGIGIPEKQCGEVFQPFKRLHGVGEYEGTGLGLATSKKIVERHEGNIWCESKDGHGTTFFFTLKGA
jgi:light-regulated signal transduction histidine kinase (bacteriophytochrome)